MPITKHYKRADFPVYFDKQPKDRT